MVDMSHTTIVDNGINEIVFLEHKQPKYSTLYIDEKGRYKL